MRGTKGSHMEAEWSLEPLWEELVKRDVTGQSHCLTGEGLLGATSSTQGVLLLDNLGTSWHLPH